MESATIIVQQMAHPIHCSRGRLVVASLMNTSVDRRNPPKMTNLAELGGVGDEALVMYTTRAHQAGKTHASNQQTGFRLRSYRDRGSSCWIVGSKRIEWAASAIRSGGAMVNR